MDYVMHHSGFSIDIWVILALILLIAVIVFFIVKRRKMVRTEKQLEELLTDQLSMDNDSSDNTPNV